MSVTDRTTFDLLVGCSGVQRTLQDVPVSEKGRDTGNAADHAWCEPYGPVESLPGDADLSASVESLHTWSLGPALVPGEVRLAVMALT